jgi:iron complex outermembrane recepter protein
MKFNLHVLALASAGALLPTVPSMGLAQTQAPAQKLPDIIVTGNPLNSAELLPPSNVLSGDGLTLKRDSTLGSTLRSVSGLSSTYFGPNADRPVIRGLDGDRIRVLNNGGANIDASSLSFDHAVPIDPLSVERIEVLRGPAALLYGGNAVGGVVNVIDSRIPRFGLQGTSGAIDARAGSGGAGRSVSAMIEGGSGGLNIHADVFERRNPNSKVPGFQYSPSRRADALAAGESGGGEREILNSQSRGSGGALGGSATWNDGFAGVALSSYRSNYGTVAEEAVTIRMKQDVLRFEAQARKLSDLIPLISIKASSTDYAHTEFEDNTAATQFKNKGSDLRIEAQHAKLGAFNGIVGAQFDNQRFAALGAEAFVPSTRSKVSSLFIYEEADFAGLKLSLGARRENSRVSSAGEDASNPDDDRFGAARTRSFGLTSASIGGLYAVSPAWSVGAQISRTERAPTFYELYADGVHVATGAYELGDPLQKKERSQSVELSLRYKQGSTSSRLSVYSTRFRNYIGLFDSGTRFELDEDGDGVLDVDVPVFNFAATPARFSGFEWEGKLRAVDAAYKLDFNAKVDRVHAVNTRTGEPLPRIAPLRVALGVDFSMGGWQAGMDIERHSAARVAAGEFRSDG